MKKQFATNISASSDPAVTDNIAAGYSLGQEWFNIASGEKFYHKFNGVWVKAGVEVPAIIIATSSNITTSTTNLNGYGQHGRNTIIDTGSTPISLTCLTASNSWFVASYTKLGSGPVSFVAGSGVTLVQVDGTLVLNGITGSTACLTRNSNTYYLQISNR